jgi:hypothetical protein
VGLGLLKTTPPSGTVKGDIFPVSNTDVVEIFFKPVNPINEDEATFKISAKWSLAHRCSG